MHYFFTLFIQLATLTFAIPAHLEPLIPAHTPIKIANPLLFKKATHSTSEKENIQILKSFIEEYETIKSAEPTHLKDFFYDSHLLIMALEAPYKKDFLPFFAKTYPLIFTELVFDKHFSKESLIYWIAKKGSIKSLELIIQQLKDIEISDHTIREKLLLKKEINHNTLLHTAAHYNQWDFIKAFIKSFPTISKTLVVQTGKNRYTIDKIIAEKGTLKDLCLFLDCLRKLKISEKTIEKKLLLKKTSNKSTLLHLLIARGKRDFVVDFLKKEEFLEIFKKLAFQKNNHKATIAEVAAEKGHIETFKTMIETLFSLHVPQNTIQEKLFFKKDDQNNTLLHLATLHNNLGFFSAFIAYFPNTVKILAVQTNIYQKNIVDIALETGGTAKVKDVIKTLQKIFSKEEIEEHFFLNQSENEKNILNLIAEEDTENFFSFLKETFPLTFKKITYQMNSN